MWRYLYLKFEVIIHFISYFNRNYALYNLCSEEWFHLYWTSSAHLETHSALSRRNHFFNNSWILTHRCSLIISLRIVIKNITFADDGVRLKTDHFKCLKNLITYSDSTHLIMRDRTSCIIACFLPLTTVLCSYSDPATL